MTKSTIAVCALRMNEFSGHQNKNYIIGKKCSATNAGEKKNYYHVCEATAENVHLLEKKLFFMCTHQNVLFEC